jgi:5-(carboxyamino)imidazole ribonucleotide synthase
VDLLTVEIEKVNTDALRKLEAEGKKVYPSAETLTIVQNKVLQKRFYAGKRIPTSPFSVFNNLDELIVAVENKHITFPFVWKSATGGYDGRGVEIVRNREQLRHLSGGECLVEDLVDIQYELSVIVARNVSGEIKTYPVVEMEFHPQANQVEYVLSPARIPDDWAVKARNLAVQVSGAFAHVGLMAVEMFVTGKGEILVNEVAPRPHNSGHFSIEGSITNQFEQHLRAILDLPLGCTETKIPAVMVNLTGEPGFYGEAVYEHLDQILKWKGVTPHIYGKKQTRPYRKMGHVTVVNQSLDKARQIAGKVKKTLRVISR